MWNFSPEFSNFLPRQSEIQNPVHVERLRSLWEVFSESQGSRGGLRTISDSKTRLNLVMSLHDPLAVRIDCGHS